MRTLVEATAFRKDIKRALKRSHDLAKLENVVNRLQRGEALPAANRAHPLKGDWKGYWDCHIEPDWLLIYKLTKDELRLARTGTHADLFSR
jgi:mRNA interferase YafQ